jgi:hypothetical protein
VLAGVGCCGAKLGDFSFCLVAKARKCRLQANGLVSAKLKRMRFVCLAGGAFGRLPAGLLASPFFWNDPNRTCGIQRTPPKILCGGLKETKNHFFSSL